MRWGLDSMRLMPDPFHTYKNVIAEGEVFTLWTSMMLYYWRKNLQVIHHKKQPNCLRAAGQLGALISNHPMKLKPRASICLMSWQCFSAGRRFTRVTVHPVKPFGKEKHRRWSGLKGKPTLPLIYAMRMAPGPNSQQLFVKPWTRQRDKVDWTLLKVSIAPAPLIICLRLLTKRRNRL